jgi:hypothetical protein
MKVLNKGMLIQKIMDEVRDTKLRDKLLAEAVADNEMMDSLIADELNKFGFKPEKVRDLVQWQFNVGIFVGYIVAAGFGLAGYVILFFALLKGDGAIILFGAALAIIGTLSFISNRKLHNTRKSSYTSRSQA